MTARDHHLLRYSLVFVWLTTALVSVWETDGAIIVFDAQTLKEVKRLPMSKPVGKYNVWNKITRSEGTSH